MIKRILPMLVLFLLVLPLEVRAQEGPTEGAACTTAGVMVRAGGPEITGPNGGNWLICNGANWIMAWNFGRDDRSNLQVDYDAGTCTTAKSGRIRYNSATTAWDYCNGSSWSSFGRNGASCNFWNQAPGYICPDGTVFAGFVAGATYVPIFTTRCDAGQTYSGSCTGTRTTRAWNNANATGHTSIATNFNDGAANTTLLIASDSNSGAGGTQPHQAAQYCADLVLNGRSDWYLPAVDELYTMVIHMSAIGGFQAGGTYWSSSEGWTENGRVVIFNNGGMGIPDTPKQGLYNVRCTRR